MRYVDWVYLAVSKTGNNLTCYTVPAIIEYIYNSITNKMHTSERVFIYNKLIHVSGYSCVQLQGGDTKDKRILKIYNYWPHQGRNV